MSSVVKIRLRKIAREDLQKYKYWQLPIHKYHDFNGPYFKKLSKEEVEQKIQSISSEMDQGNDDPLAGKRIISNEHNELIGEVNWYWKSRETNWLEVGLVIFDESNWERV